MTENTTQRHTTEIDGDLTVCRSLTTGGGVRVGRSMTVMGDLRVRGRVEMPDLPNPCKGLFQTADALNTAWPAPEPGWWALVGTGLPASVMTVRNGVWQATGGQGGLATPDMRRYEERLDAIEESVAALDTPETEDFRRVEATLAELTEERPAPGSMTVCDHCAGLTGSDVPLYTRSNFSGFGFDMGRIDVPFNMVTFPLMCADWEGNTDAVTSVMVTLRRGGPTGERVYERLFHVTSIPPGESREISLLLDSVPLSPGGAVWLDLRMDAPCTMMKLQTKADIGTTLNSRYYIAGRQITDDKGFEPVNFDSYWYVRCSLSLSTGTVTGLSVTALEDTARRLGLYEMSGNGAAVTDGTGSVALRLPPTLYAVPGDTLQLFYRGMVADSDPLRHRPMLQGSVGRDFIRYWEYTPALSEAGARMTLHLTAHDAGGSVTGSVPVTLRTVPRPADGSAAGPLNVVCIGDSLTAGGEWPREVWRRMCGTGGTPAGLGVTGIRFCGRQSALCGSTPVGWTGYGGWHWKSYTSLAQTAGISNPLWNQTDGGMDFGMFAASHCGGRIDVVYVMLGWNALIPVSPGYESMVEEARRFARALFAAFPEARLRLMGIQLPSPTGGLGTSYGSAAGSYADLYAVTQGVHYLNRAYAAMAAEPEWQGRVAYVEIAAQFDSDFNMPSSSVPVNSRSTHTEQRGTNGIHPASGGYMQIADAVWRDMCALLAGM